MQMPNFVTRLDVSVKISKILLHYHKSKCFSDKSFIKFSSSLIEIAVYS